MTERFFNTSGPVVPADHYCLPPLERFDLDEVLRLIAAKRYAGGSAFNIKAKSLRLGDFDESDVHVLLAQHMEETGQVFTEDALAAVWKQSRGQPWLVNALADQACFGCKANRDRSRTIDGEEIMEAREELILSRQTHLHQLADKLQEERVRRVIAPILSGGAEPGTPARRYVVECKILRGSLEATLREGLEQTLAYMDKCGAESGHLVIFDRDESKPWEEKLYRRREPLDGRTVAVWGA